MHILSLKFPIILRLTYEFKKVNNLELTVGFAIFPEADSSLFFPLYNTATKSLEKLELHS